VHLAYPHAQIGDGTAPCFGPPESFKASLTTTHRWLPTTTRTPVPPLHTECTHVQGGHAHGRRPYFGSKSITTTTANPQRHSVLPPKAPVRRAQTPHLTNPNVVVGAQPSDSTSTEGNTGSLTRPSPSTVRPGGDGSGEFTTTQQPQTDTILPGPPQTGNPLAQTPHDGTSTAHPSSSSSSNLPSAAAPATNSLTSSATASHSSSPSTPSITPADSQQPPPKTFPLPAVVIPCLLVAAAIAFGVFCVAKQRRNRKKAFVAASKGKGEDREAENEVSGDSEKPSGKHVGFELPAAEADGSMNRGVGAEADENLNRVVGMGIPVGGRKGALSMGAAGGKLEVIEEEGEEGGETSRGVRDARKTMSVRSSHDSRLWDASVGAPREWKAQNWTPVGGGGKMKRADYEAGGFI